MTVIVKRMHCCQLVCSVDSTCRSDIKRIVTDDTNQAAATNTSCVLTFQQPKKAKMKELTVNAVAICPRLL